MRRKIAAGLVLTLTMSMAGATDAGAALSKAKARHKAQSVLLKIEDMPTGWTSTPPTPATAKDEQDASDLAACTGAADPARDLADIDGATFDQGNASVSSSAEVVASGADYRRDTAALLGKKMKGCFRRSLSKMFAENDLTVQKMTFTRFRVERHGDLSTGMRMVFTVATEGQTVDIHFDGVALGKAPVELSLTFTNIGAPFDPILENRLISLAGKRVDKL